MRHALPAAGCLAVAALLMAQQSPPERVGPLPDGGFRLNSGWRIAPAGKQVALDTFPMSAAATPDGKYLFVLHSGTRPPMITAIDAASGTVTSTLPVADAWLGIAVSPRGDRVYVGGGSRAAIFELTFANGKLAAGRTFDAVPAASRGRQDFIGDVTFDREGHLLYAAELYRNSLVVINPQSGLVLNRIKTGRRPYRVLFHPDGKSFFVSHWADGSVGQYDTGSGSSIGLVRIAPHPTDLVYREGGAPDEVEGAPKYNGRLFVAAANTNSVYSVAVTPSKQLSLLETINIAMTSRQPLGMTPSALALSPDRSRLFVACSGANAVAVVDLTGNRGHLEGWIPSGWYPTAVRALPSGTLAVLNGKGVRSYPRPKGAVPPGQQQTGSASWIPAFTSEQLQQWTRQALANSAYHDGLLDQSPPLPTAAHVVYIVQESSSYDQILGDLKGGNGDSSLAAFGESVTPNQHKLAAEFALFDNFYANGDDDWDGHNWATAAIASDYVEKLWPSQAAGRLKTDGSEDQDPASLPPAGYLWTNAVTAGITMRNFGYMATNVSPAPEAGKPQVASVRDPVLAKVTNMNFRGFDPQYADTARAKAFLDELATYEKDAAMPRLVVIRLGSEYTTAGAAADNDHALGMIVEGITKSRFWSSTAIFVVRAGARNGADHVDSHRSTAFVISPFVRRHSVDSKMYNTTSALRTIELFLGLRPMTHFDAGATPMAAVFQTQADTTPFTAEKPRVAPDKSPASTPARNALGN